LELATDFGSGLINLGLVYRANKEFKDYDLNLIGIMTKNRLEWMMTEFANILYRNTMTPMYENADNKMVSHVLQQTNILTIVGTNISLNTILKLENRYNLKNFINVEEASDEQKKKAEELGIKIYTFDEVVNNGKQKKQAYAKVNKEDIFTFSYTSGTTGTGKACMLSHGNMVSGVAVVEQYLDVKESDVYMSYLPLAHMFERLLLNAIVRYGATSIFSCGDIL